MKSNPAPDRRSGIMQLWTNILAAALEGGREVWVSSKPPPGAEGGVSAGETGVWLRWGDAWNLRMTVPAAIGTELPGALDAYLGAGGPAATLLPPEHAAVRVEAVRSDGGYRVLLNRGGVKS